MKSFAKATHNPASHCGDATCEPGAIAVGALTELGSRITLVYGKIWIAKSIDGNAPQQDHEPVALPAGVFLLRWAASSFDRLLYASNTS